ncbi:MAG: 30S ribosomal protein S17 [Wolbachia endosymbiont of Menacanthus eurysternus]|nr:MAG: 30S ribosomal protein S17 [Wolbachia endosymbiont of Menacanthus eurysternus]
MSRKFYGIVTRVKCNKTIKVSLLRVYRNKFYKKIIKRYKKYTVHDENNVCREGDRVLIQEHKPVSATKKWIATRIE